MNPKLTQALDRIDKIIAENKFPKIQGGYYRKAKNPELKCEACFVGALAFGLGAKVSKNAMPLLGTDITNHISFDDDIGVTPLDVFEKAGIPYDLLQEKIDTVDIDGNPICDRNLAYAVVDANDTTNHTFQEIAAWFRKEIERRADLPEYNDVVYS